MRDHYNPCRLYCLNDESGLVICSWPQDKERPAIPAPYSQETMHGFEYAAADLMIKRGMVENSLKVVKGIRDPYDGRRRNPWNEIECGSNYARSMASYSLLLTYSGFSFDARRKHLGFIPLIKGDSSDFWSCGSAWGEISLDSLELPLTLDNARLKENSLTGERKGSVYLFTDTLLLKEGDVLSFS